MRSSRRSVLRLLGAGALAGLPTPALASGATDRRFLFVYLPGGLDQCYLSAPLFGRSGIDMEEDAELVETHGIVHVASPSRPSVEDFFEAHGADCVLINGVEHRSIAHDVCRRLLFTGASLAGLDDWPARLAGARPDLLMPGLLISGPSYTASEASTILRLGGNNQLQKLLSGDALRQASPSYSPPPSAVEALEEAFALERARLRATAPRRGRVAELLAAAAQAEESRQRLLAASGDLELGSARELADMLELALDCFEQDLSRVAVLSYEGYQDWGWDTHADNRIQGIHLELLFEALGSAMGGLAARPAAGGGSLADEVVLVVISEMGRFPQLNGSLGKEHWTFTSALLAGAGLNGGQTIGGWDDTCAGRPVDLESGEPSDSGEALLPGHLGATLLALAGLDPAAEGIAEAPIGAALA